LGKSKKSGKLGKWKKGTSEHKDLKIRVFCSMKLCVMLFVSRATPSIQRIYGVLFFAFCKYVLQKSWFRLFFNFFR